jgi:response regulator of citrate/malate metabolism
MHGPARPPEPILIVDDEEEFLRSAEVSFRLARLGNVELCPDSREVMPLLSRKSASVVLLDLSMPHVAGPELLPQISQEFPGIPVIVITADNELETAVSCMKAGAFDYLVKPVDGTRLEPGPSLGTGRESRSYLAGIAKTGGRFLLILDMERAFTTEETESLEAAAAAGAPAEGGAS